MKPLGKIVFGISGIVVLALVLALAAPKSVRAVVSALVTVANTPANPVPTTDVMRSVAQNVELVCQPRSGDVNCFLVPPTGLAGSATEYVVPSGSNLVITDLEIWAPQGDGSPTNFLLISMTPTTPENPENWIVAGDGLTHEFVFPTGKVIPPGATLSASTNKSEFITTIRGYLTTN